MTARQATARAARWTTHAGVAPARLSHVTAFGSNRGPTVSRCPSCRIGAREFLPARHALARPRSGHSSRFVATRAKTPCEGVVLPRCLAS